MLIKKLNRNHFFPIQSFLNDNVPADAENILQIKYSQEYLYWFLESGNSIYGLIYEKNIIGLSFVVFCHLKNNFSTDNYLFDAAYIHLFCLHRKINCPKMHNLFWDLLGKELTYPIITVVPLHHLFYSTLDFFVPINYQKLYEIGFIDQFDTMTKKEICPLITMSPKFLPEVIHKLNNYIQKFELSVFFSKNNSHYLLPYKNIIYAFVLKMNDEITDFVSVLLHEYLYIEKQTKLITAELAFYFSPDLNKLITYLLHKLRDYEIDQLLIRNWMDNDKINITKYLSYGRVNYYSPSLRSTSLAMIPFR
jgi:hypothetical protein